MPDNPVPLPDFFLGGAAKSGTTSLWKYLKQHSQVCIDTKEINFWNRHFDRGVDWYTSHFDPCSDDSLVGDASVSTLADAEITAPRITDALTDPLLIVILRHPVERAYSEFWHLVRMEFFRHREPSPQLFEDVILGREYIPTRWPEDMGIGERMVEKGMYYDQLQEFTRRIGRDHVHIAFFEEFVQDEEAVVSDIFNFLDLRPEPISTGEQHMRGKYPSYPTLNKLVHDVWYSVRPLLPDPLLDVTTLLRNRMRMTLYSDQEKPEMTERARRYLQEYYAEQIRGVEQMTGRTLDHWM
jgi:hypothetical protein